MEWLSESLVASRRYIWVTPSHGFIYKVDGEQLTQQPPAGLMEVKLTIRLRRLGRSKTAQIFQSAKLVALGLLSMMAAKHGPSPKRLSRAKTPFHCPRKIVASSLKVCTSTLCLYLDRGGPRKMADGPGVFALPAALPTWHPPGGISIDSNQELAMLGLANVQRMAPPNLRGRARVFHSIPSID